MIVLLNGAFGIGKTSVARCFASALPDTLLYDPEPLGIALQRGARLVGRAVSDFQDLALWRRLSIAGIRVARWIRPNVVVPMAFSNRSHLTEVLEGISPFDRRIVHFCLVAPVEVVHARLSSRGADPASRDGAWQFRRASECCAAHRDPFFSEQVEAVGREPAQIAQELVQKVMEPARSMRPPYGGPREERPSE